VLRPMKGLTMCTRWTDVLALVIIGTLVVGPQNHTQAQTPVPAEVISVAWSPDGTRIAGGGTNGLLRIWDASGQTLLTVTGLNGAVYSVDWSPDSAKIVSGHDDANVRVWDAKSGQLLATLVGHGDVIQSVAWSPDGSKIASTSLKDDNNLRVWDATSYEAIATADQAFLYDVRWKPDSTELAIGNENGKVAVYSA
jgi:WD40 repeat protein